MIKSGTSLPFTWDSSGQLLTLLDCVKYGEHVGIVYMIEWETYKLEISGLACVRIVLPDWSFSSLGACTGCSPTQLERIASISIEEMLTHKLELVRMKVKCVLKGYPWLAEDDTHSRKLNVFAAE